MNNMGMKTRIIITIIHHVCIIMYSSSIEELILYEIIESATTKERTSLLYLSCVVILMGHGLVFAIKHWTTSKFILL